DILTGGRMSQQAVQKGQISHPPNPGVPRRALSAGKAAAPRLTLVSRFTVPGNDARTMLEDFFNSLLVSAGGRVARSVALSGWGCRRRRRGLGGGLGRRLL